MKARQAEESHLLGHWVYTRAKDFYSKFDGQRIVKIIWYSHRILAKLVIASTFILSSCSYNPFISNNHTTGSPVGAAIGAGVAGGLIYGVGGSKPLAAIAGIGGGMFGYYVTTLRHQAGPIIANGGTVYTVGNYLGIYIPSDSLFEPNTARLLPTAKPILNSAATVLQRYPNNNVIISGNSAGFYRSRWEQRLSERRARVVSAFLWKAGVNDFKERTNDTRRLNYVGYGDFFPISQKYTNKGLQANNRIQITAYPTNCNIHLEKLDQTVHNMGSINDADVYSRITECDKNDPYCFSEG